MSTNQIDDNIAIVLSDQRERTRTYYQENKATILEYAHNYYAINREKILQKKKIYNDKPENRVRRRNYMRVYMRDHYQDRKEKKMKNVL